MTQLAHKLTNEDIAGMETLVQTGEHIQKRRVFFLLDSFNVGGTETQAVELALRLDPANYEVTLGCLKHEGPLLARLHSSAVKVTEFHPQGGFDSPGGIYQLARMQSFLRRGTFDVVHTHDLWSNLIGVPAAKMAGVPVIISSQRDLSHDPWYKTTKGRLLRAVQRGSSAVLTNAEAIRTGLIEDEGFIPRRVRVIYNGVDVDRFRSVQADRERLFPGTAGQKLVVLVGNMHSDVKGQPTVIAAASKVLQHFPQTRFVFVGDGERRTDFEQQAAKFGKAFVFLGRREDIPEILASCDIALLPSAAEGMPNAVLEYMAAGLPVIASRVGGNVEAIEDGISGLLIPAGDSGALADSLMRLLDDEPFAHRLAQSAQKSVRERFSFENLTHNIDSLYTELLGSQISK
jgi:glycosyltransferase involved in cell wall biosynthesis